MLELSPESGTCRERAESTIYERFTENPGLLFWGLSELLKIFPNGLVTSGICTPISAGWPEVVHLAMFNLGRQAEIKIHGFDNNKSQIKYWREHKNKVINYVISEFSIKEDLKSEYETSALEARPTWSVKTLEIFSMYRKLPRGSILFMSNIPDFASNYLQGGSKGF